MCACAVSQPSSPIECNESLRIATVELWKESSAPADRPSLFNIPVIASKTQKQMDSGKYNPKGNLAVNVSNAVPISNDIVGGFI